MKFRKGGKMSPRYIGPFVVWTQVNEVAYKLAHPPSLSVINLVFHVSMLKKYMPDGPHKLQHEGLDIELDLFYEEQATWILNQSMKTLHRMDVPLMKVLWLWQGVHEAMWECEDELRRYFPRLLSLDNVESRY